MSTGETPPTPRFTSPSNTSNPPPKKYPGTPKSPLTTSATTVNNRGSLTRQRLLTPKVSAPRPMNLPSLRKEHSAGSEVLSSSPSTTSHGWGSSTSSSPSNSFTQPSELENKVNATEQLSTSPILDPTEIDAKNTKTLKADLASSPPSQPSTTTRAWAIPAKTQTNSQPPSTDFPTAAEAASKKKSSVYDDKEYLKYASSDPNHTSWDEMVSEDLDEFSVDVVEFDDGTKVQIEGTEESVNPSDRFTEDYDRSYPPKTTHHNHDSMDHHHTNYKSNYRRSEDHGYNNARYNNSVHGYDNRRHSSATTNDRWNNNHHRRESADSNGNNRRSSYDKKSTGSGTSHHINNNSSSYHPTLLQRPRRLSEQSFRSDHSREDTFHMEHHPNALQIIPEPSTSSTIPPVTEEITAAQREVMLTAAERAKKRRDEQEAEFEAARIRAKQKADALAEKARLDAEKKAKESSKEEKNEPTTKTTDKKSTKDSESSTIKPILKKKDSTTTAETSTQSSTTTPRPSSTIMDTSKPWNLVAANKKITIEKRPKAEPTTEKDKETEKPKESEKVKESEKDTADPVVEPPKKIERPKFDKDGKPLNEDEQNWEMYVSRIKSDSAKPAARPEVTSNAWNSFATRLQQSVIDNQKAFEAKHKASLAEKQKETVVEEMQYTEMEQTDSHSNSLGKGQNRGWTRNEDEHGGYTRGERGGRGRGMHDRSVRGARSVQGTNRRQTDNPHWRQSNDNTEHEKEPTPVITEILKHEPATSTPNNNISKKTRLTNLLKESTSPIFPSAIQKLVGKKPAHISFMIDMDESDRDITMMDVVVEVKKEDPPVVAESKDEQSVPEVADVPNVEAPSAPEPLEETSVPEPVEESSAPESLEAPSASESVEAHNVPEAVDETSATSSTTSTPPRSQFQQNSHGKLDSSPQRLNVNPNFPVLVYQYPVSQQQQQDTTSNGYSNGYSSRSKGYQQQQQQRPMGVYLMPPQQYMAGNQYIVPYPQAGTGVQPMYYPAVPWQSQYNNNNGSGSSPRPHFEQRRPKNNHNNVSHNTPNHMSKWEAHSNSAAYQSHRPAFHNNQRGGYRSRGSWSTSPRGRGGYNNNHHSLARRYPDVNTVSPSSLPEQHSSSETNNL